MSRPARCGVVALLVALLVSSSASALSSERAITQYAHDVWTSRDGLPEGAVLAIRETSDGYLWLGTQCCLVRYDGERFTQYQSGQLGLKQHSFGRDLLETPDHALWAALVGGVARYADGRFQWYDQDQGLRHPFVYALAAGVGGTLWAGTGGAGVWGLRHGRFVPHSAYATDPTLPAKVNALTTDAEGVLWAATDEGVLALGSKVRRFKVQDGLPSDVAGVLLFDHAGVLWVGTREGLARSSREGDPHFEVADEFQGADITALLEDRQQNLWIGSRGALYRKTGSAVQAVRDDHGGLFALAEDQHGALWVGTGEGLERFRDAAFTTVGLREGLQNEQVLNVHSRRAGGLWVLDGSGALWLEEHGRRTPVASAGTIVGSGMLGLAETADGSLWVGARELQRLHDGVWTSYAHEGGGFSVVEEDGDGLIVAQTEGDGRSTLSRFQGGRFSPVAIGAPLSHVQRILRGRDGSLWVSTGGNGLVHLSSGKTRTFRSADGLPHDVVYGLAEDEDHSLWVATRGGLARVRGDRVVGFANTPGVPNRSPVHVLLDGLGYLWVTADDGVHRLSVAELNRAADDPTREVTADVFTTRDGLRSVEVSWRCSAQTLTSDGRLYYATARGLASIETKSVVRDIVAPRVRIEAVSIAGKLLDPAPQTALVSNRSDRVEIRYSSPALWNAEGISFRYRLVGYEKEWVLAGSNRTAHYANLPAGDYRFNVSARRAGGEWLAPAPALRLSVSPRWYETALARLLATIAAALAGYGLYRVQQLRSRRSERLLTARVLERTEQLRQEVIERQAAETRVRELADGLEARVQQRTAQLELATFAARKNAERFALAVRGAQDGLWDWDFAAGWLYLSPRWKAMLGYADNELNSSLEAWLSHVHPDDLAALRYAIEPRSDHSGQIRLEYRMMDRTGAELWVLCRGIILFDDDHRALRAAGSQSDITRRKLAEAELRRNATHDSLTGLPNRSLFADRLGQAVLRARQVEQQQCAVLFLDLDHFKVVNDSLGHAAGDQLLVELATRLSASLRETETAARLGGDEFGVLLPELPDPDYATRVAERLQQVIAVPIELGENQVTVAASIGIKLSGVHDEIDDFMRDADTAMYRAKAGGRGRHQLFDQRMRDDALERTRIEFGLRRALADGHLELHYQPLISLITGLPVGVEALVRWRDPERGLVAPGVFIGVAEACGLIVPLSEWVLATACAQAKHWQGRLRSSVRIAINVAPALLNDLRLASKIEAELSRQELAGSALGIEIVETSVLETSETVLDNLNQLRSMGVQIAIDDFGTGYSSFGYLKRLPINYLKIDRSLTQSIPADTNDTAICKAILSMATELDLVAVAEGVETSEQAEFLRVNGCGVAQGYYFSRPLPAGECSAFLERLLSVRPKASEHRPVLVRSG